MNSFITNATRVRRVHQGMSAQCDGVLPRIPEDADLASFLDLDVVHELLHKAVQTPTVLIPVATNILHRKRRSLIPMLDNVVLEYYLKATGKGAFLPETENKTRAANAAIEVLKAFRDDLGRVRPQLEAIAESLRPKFRMTPLRILEVLVWTEKEPSQPGYYRNV